MSKGKQIEKLAFDMLRVAGYEVEKPSPRLVQTKQGYITLHHDLWGIWDFCAVNKKEIRFIQVASKYASQKTKADQIAMKEFKVPPCARKEFWRWDDKKGDFIIEQIKGGNNHA